MKCQFLDKSQWLPETIITVNAPNNRSHQLSDQCHNLAPSQVKEMHLFPFHSKKNSVPQDTVLALVLFLISEKDINYSTVSSFADDTRIFTSRQYKGHGKPPI